MVASCVYSSGGDWISSDTVKSEDREAANISFQKLVLKDSEDGSNYLYDTSVIKKY